MASPNFIERFGVKTIVIHGITLAASLFMASAMADSRQVVQGNVVDLAQRQTIISNMGNGNRVPLKLAEFGEVADQSLGAKLYSEEAAKQKIITERHVTALAGQASYLAKGRFSNDFDVCLINHSQANSLTDDREYYLFAYDSPTIYNKQYVDAFTKSHESQHCFFFIQFPEKYKQPERFEHDHIAGSTYKRYNDYVMSLNEIAGDLAVVLDYMRQTGTKDIYTEFQRPWRISAIGLTNHKTAWALDEILKGIDPVSIQRKDASEIPAIVEGLMSKHFLGQDGTYFPDALPLDGSRLSNETPASRALYDEIRADMRVNNVLPGEEPALVERFKKDVHDSVSLNISSYAHKSPQAVGVAMKLYSGLAKQYDLEKLSFSINGEPAKDPKAVTSFVDPYLKLMITP